MLLLLSLAWATTITPLPFDAVAARASTIVVATLGEPHTFVGPDRVIRTRVPLHLVEPLAGAPPPVEIWFTGGERDGRTQRVHGMPGFEPGVRAVLFIEGDGRTWACPTVGWHQGFLPVAPDGDLPDHPGVPADLAALRRWLRAR